MFQFSVTFTVLQLKVFNSNVLDIQYMYKYYMLTSDIYIFQFTFTVLQLKVFNSSYCVYRCILDNSLQSNIRHNFSCVTA